MKLGLLKAPVYILVIPVLLFGCRTYSATSVDVPPTADISSIKTVAVWKFYGRRYPTYADSRGVGDPGDIVTSAFENALEMKGFKVVPYSKIHRILPIREGMALEVGAVTSRVLRRVRDETGADALVRGSAHVSHGKLLAASWIHCSFQMIDTVTGEILVSGEVRDGERFSSPESVAKKVAEEAVNNIR
jgi:hypothetical protein